jgi:indolepyruvate decarboxylase
MMTMSIGSFLFDRLVCLGASHIYGVQGDYNLEFLYLLKNSKRLSFVGTCNELNAGYAADGGAPSHWHFCRPHDVWRRRPCRLLGAGAYAEGVPVLSISGAPPLRAIRSKTLLHHTLTDGACAGVRNPSHKRHRSFKRFQGFLCHVDKGAKLWS